MNNNLDFSFLNTDSRDRFSSIYRLVRRVARYVAANEKKKKKYNSRL